MNDAELLADIAQNFPSLVVESWRPLGEGWMSRALLVNESYVFRFAKHAEAAADLAKEVALLPSIGARVSLPVPRFELVGTQRSGLGLVGYRQLEGEPLEADVFAKLSSEQQTRVVMQLATFMNELHGMPCELAERAGLTVTDHRSEYTQDWQALRDYAAKLPAAVARYSERRFLEFLAEPSYFDNPPRLIHADLSPEHLLLDRARGKLVGIIDFGDVSLGDPDYEYLYLLEDLGVPFTTRVMIERAEPDIAGLLRKVGYYVTFDHVHSILGGLQHGVSQWVDEGVAALAAEAQSQLP